MYAPTRLLQENKDLIVCPRCGTFHERFNICGRFCQSQPKFKVTLIRRQLLRESARADGQDKERDAQLRSLRRDAADDAGQGAHRALCRRRYAQAQQARPAARQIHRHARQ